MISRKVLDLLQQSTDDGSGRAELWDGRISIGTKLLHQTGPVSFRFGHVDLKDD